MGQKTKTPILAKVGSAKVGQLRMAKVGFAKVGRRGAHAVAMNCWKPNMKRGNRIKGSGVQMKIPRRFVEESRSLFFQLKFKFLLIN